jgi:tumor protein p53-inducible protein 3
MRRIAGLLLALLLGPYAAASLMRAVVQDVVMGPLRVSSAVKVPQIYPREVLIRVNYTALNRMDLVQAKGLYPLPPGVSEILGVEVSGIIEAVGTDCRKGFAVGDTVMALLMGGGYAEFVAVDERTVMKTLPGVDLSVSAAIPEAFMTAYQLLFLVSNMRSGESVLIHAASSSVGQAAIQMAVNKGIKVFATARSSEKIAKCLSLGAAHGFVVGDNVSFADDLRVVNGGDGVDVILDPVGSTYLNENLNSIKDDGRFVLYGLLSGGVVDASLNNNSPNGFMRKLLFKRVQLLTTTLRTRTEQYKEKLITALEQDSQSGFPAIIAGRMRVEIDSIFPMENVSQAHAHMANNKNIGKILMQVSATQGPPIKVEQKVDSNTISVAKLVISLFIGFLLAGSFTKWHLAQGADSTKEKAQRIDRNVSLSSDAGSSVASTPEPVIAFPSEDLNE